MSNQPPAATSRTSRDVCLDAIEALTRVVNQVRDEQWDQALPATLPQADPSAPKTLRAVVNALAYDLAWIPDMLAGTSMAAAGATKFDGDLLGPAPTERFATIAATGSTAIRDLTDLDRAVQCSYATYPARAYLVDIGSYYGLSAYDLATVIGADPTLPPALVAGLWEQLEPVADQWRELGIFGPKVDVSANADLQTRLLGLTGRQP